MASVQAEDVTGDGSATGENQEELASSPTVAQAGSEKYEVVQTAYQQPEPRTYSSPPHENWGPPYPGPGYPQNPFPQQLPYPNAHAAPPQQEWSGPPLDHYEELPPPLEATSPARVSPAAPNQSATDVEATHAAMQHHTPQVQVMNGLTVSTNEQAASHVQPIDGFDPSFPGGTLMHLSDGIRVSGSQLRDRPPTATERALQLKTENDALRQKLSSLESRVDVLSGDIKRRDEALVAADRLTQEAHRANAMLRDSIATHKVRLKAAENETLSARRSSDAALAEIESTLDAVLLNKLTRQK